MHPDGLTARKGWIKVSKADMAFLGEQLNVASASPKAVWIALMTLADEQRTDRVNAAVGLIASVADVSRPTAKRALNTLTALRFITVEHHRVPGRKEWGESTYTLLRGEYAAPRSVQFEPRSVHGHANNLNQCLKTAETSKTIPPPPPAGELSYFVVRFRRIRKEFENPQLQDHQIAEAVAACPAGEDRERGFADFERDAATALKGMDNPLKMLRAYMAKAAEGPKPERGVHHGKVKRTRDTAGQFPEPVREIKQL